MKLPISRQTAVPALAPRMPTGTTLAQDKLDSAKLTGNEA